MVYFILFYLDMKLYKIDSFFFRQILTAIERSKIRFLLVLFKIAFVKYFTNFIYE